MASYGTRQQWQQPHPQRQHQYDSRPDPRQYQGQPPPQRGPPQRVEQYNKYNTPQTGYENGYSGYENQQYDQQGYWQEQQYQEQYQYNDHSQDPYAQNQAHGRSYHYDEAYHTNGEHRPQMNGHYPQDNHNPRERPRPAQLPQEHRQKPRERILAEPKSPKTLAWDNPFGAFPPKKKESSHRRHASLDKGISGMSLDPPHNSSPGQRPHTSQDHRKPDPGRPSTSHGHHANTRPLESPRLPNENMPLRKQPPPPSGPRSDAPPRQVGTGLPARPTPQRSVTQPTDAQPPPSQYADPFYQEKGHGQPALRPPPMQRPTMANPPQQQRPPVVRQKVDQAYNTEPLPESYDRSAYRGVAPHKPTSNQAQEPPNFTASPPPSTHQQTDMPNFDAIPAAVDETHIAPSPQTQAQEQPAYAKQSYQAYQALPSIDTKRAQPPPPEATRESPLADFSFGLPQNNQGAPSLKAPSLPQNQIQPSMTSPISYDNPPRATAAPIRYDNPPTSHESGQYDQPPTYDARVQPGGQRVLSRQQSPASHFPPRGASRPGPQPRSASDAHANPPINAMGNQQYSPEQMQPRPATSQAARGAHGYAGEYEQAYDRRQPYGQGYDKRPPHPQGQQYAQGDPYGPDDYNQGYGQRLPRVPPPQDGYSATPPRPSTSNSAYPVPVRNYGDRHSTENARPDMLPVPNAGLGDRPVPYRPGLAGVNARAQSPAPVLTQQPQQAPPQPRQTPEAATGPPVTVAELNSLRESFKNKPEDWGLGLRFAKRLVEAASVLSSENGRADAKTTAKNRERYILDAHKILKKLVAAGSPEAMFYLADCHGQGKLGLAPDPKEAFALYQSGAKLNHPQSAYRVAVCCELGQEEGGGTRRDPIKAVQWYKRAATLGDTPAMYKLGMILLKGLLGQQKNPREAVSWLKRAAERADKDNPHALHELGLLYESATQNDHILRDEGYALQLFQQAAELGYKYSQFRLGSAWEYGLLGCQIDARQSIAWYTRAAAQGEHQSELALSGWYLTGSEPLLQQSDQEAYLWARKAASSGLAKAEYAMGYFTEVGIGTKVDAEEAKRWYCRAAAQNFPKARERLEELKRGATKQSRTRVSRTGRSEGDCVVM